MAVEIIQVDDKNWRCGWCQDWIYSAPSALAHAEQHLDTLKRLRAVAKVVLTVANQEDEDDPT